MAWTHATTRSTGFPVTAAVWDAEVVDNMNYLERVHYSQFTADKTVSVTSEATATSVLAGSAVTYQAVPHLFRFFAPSFDSNGATLHIILCDGSTVLGDLYQGAGSGNADALGTVECVLTPTAASHTYNIKAWIASGSGTIHAGAGGTGATRFPGFLRISREVV